MMFCLSPFRVPPFFCRGNETLRLCEFGLLTARRTMLARNIPRIKASAAGGGLSRFGERAARMLFRMADKVRRRRRMYYTDRDKTAFGQGLLVCLPEFAVTTHVAKYHSMEHRHRVYILAGRTVIINAETSFIAFSTRVSRSLSRELDFLPIHSALSNRGSNFPSPRRRSFHHHRSSHTLLLVSRSHCHCERQDQDGGLNFSELLGMLRRMGMRGTQHAMATELDYIRTLKVSRSVNTESERFFKPRHTFRTCIMLALNTRFVFIITPHTPRTPSSRCRRRDIVSRCFPIELTSRLPLANLMPPDPLPNACQNNSGTGCQNGQKRVSLGGRPRGFLPRLRPTRGRCRSRRGKFSEIH